jgi:uncharacterized protein YjiS (DUF1127 family)
VTVGGLGWRHLPLAALHQIGRHESTSNNLMIYVKIIRLPDEKPAAIRGRHVASKEIVMPARSLSHSETFGFAGPAAGSLVAWFKRAWRAYASRQALADLDDRMLRDIGLTRLDAQREADRQPWDH